MLSSGKSQQGLIEILRLPGNACLSSILFMSHNGITESMMSMILMILICIMLTGLRSMKQCQTDGIIIRLIPSIFRFIQNGYAIRRIIGSQVGPLMSQYLKRVLDIVAALHIT